MFTYMIITINTNSLFYPGIIDLSGEMAKTHGATVESGGDDQRRA